MDLSDPEAAISELEKYPKPDVIFASPPCETWVKVSIGNINKVSDVKEVINLYWAKKWEPVKYKKIEQEEKYGEKRMMGIKTAITTAKIIQHFKPEFWAIENGNSSLIFDYIKDFCGLKGYKNKCNYYAYGMNVFKPTLIYSVKKLSLLYEKPRAQLVSVCNNEYGELRKKKKQLNLICNKKDYSKRSQVPAALYRDIMRQFEHGGQPALFPLEEVS
jgi:hypothetical protein